MSFHHPQLLWLLALPVVWGFWQWVRRGHPLVLPFDHGQQREGRWLRALVNLAGTLPAVLLAIAVLMLAGPRQPAPPLDERVLNNIIICLDVSGSMGVPFGQKGTRFEAAVEATRQFCSFRKGDAFGLTIFGSEYVHWIPPTKELSAIINATKYVRPDNMPAWMGGTLIANALRGCRDELVGVAEGDRAVVLITDGGSGDFQNGGDRAVAAGTRRRAKSACSACSSARMISAAWVSAGSIPSRRPPAARFSPRATTPRWPPSSMRSTACKRPNSSRSPPTGSMITRRWR